MEGHSNRSNRALFAGLVLASFCCRPSAAVAAPETVVADPCFDPPNAAPAQHALEAFARDGTHGIDVSHFNGSVPWKALRDAGLAYVFVKASEGPKYVDPAFHVHWAAAKRCKLPRGAYHFLHPELDPVEQARHFLEVVGADRGELPVVVDVERGFGGSKVNCGMLEAAVKKYLEEVERVTGQKAMIYSGHAFWTQQLCDTKAFKDRPLWIAHYGDQPPRLFGGWAEWNFWQYTDHARLTRVTFDLDRSSFKKHELAGRAGGS